MAHIKLDGKIILAGCLVISDKRELLLLFRKDHGHYETPGGKMDLQECSNPESPSISDLAKTAKRELHEELGDDIQVSDLEYFGCVEFKIPDGRLAIAHKFLTKIISGRPKINEPEIFTKFDYLPLDRLEVHPISPDLKLLLNKLKDIKL